MNKKFLIGLTIALTSTISLADQFYLTVGFECKSNDGELAVWFRGYENEDGEQAVLHLTKNDFDPRSLVIFHLNSDGRYTIKTKNILKKCVLNRQNYSIEISPLLASNFNPEGFCASRVGAKVAVKINKKILVTEGFDACTDVGQITTDFVVSPNRETTYKKLAMRDFFTKN